MKIQLITALTVLPLTLLGCTVEPGENSPTAAAPGETTTTDSETPNGARKTVVYSVKGMSCQGCANAVTDKVAKIDGVMTCEVSLQEQRAKVELAEGCSAEDVETAIRTLGYEVAPEDENPAS